MVQGSFTPQTTLIEHLSYANYLVSVGDKMLSKRRRVSAHEKFIVIKENINYYLDIK